MPSIKIGSVVRLCKAGKNVGYPQLQEGVLGRVVSAQSETPTEQFEIEFDGINRRFSLLGSEVELVSA